MSSGTLRAKLATMRLAHAAALLALAAPALAAGPGIPAALQPPAGEHLVLKAHATGVQIYVCVPGADGASQWTLKAPEAQLRDARGSPVIHHFAGPTWQHRDGSEVTGKVAARVDSPDPHSIAWLLVTVASHSGEGVLAAVTSIQRIRTHGGQPPAASKCDGATRDAEIRVPYSADYYFYAPGS